MSTTIRNEVSKRNPYYIPKHRYLELKHFCLQYPIWKKAAESLLGLQSKPDYILQRAFGKHVLRSSPTELVAEARENFLGKMSIIEKAAKLADSTVSDALIECVTKGRSYDKLNASRIIPCGRTNFYILYRKFFWILSNLRD